MITRQVRMLTAELRILLADAWWTQEQLAVTLTASQRKINSRLQTMNRFGELLKKNHGYGTTAYKLSVKGLRRLQRTQALEESTR